ncbi:MAG: S41 family peptidase [Muribaculaceae bacterium]|nr:S41 family peptidase [Muribaculaceae bacterium]
MSIKKSIYLSAVILSVTAIVASGAKPRSVASNAMEYQRVFTTVVQNHVDTLDPTHLTETALEAMLYELDPYTSYFSPSEENPMDRLKDNSYYGIGTTLQLRGDSIEVAFPMDGTPAREAGLRPGDRFMAIDGVAVPRGAGIEYVSSRLRAKGDEPVKLTLYRPYAGADTVYTVSVRRRIISTDPIAYAGMVNPQQGVGYIRVTDFEEQTGRRFRQALDSLAAGGELKSIVIDLRNNPGGLLAASVEMLENFLPRGTRVVTIKGRGRGTTSVYRTSKTPAYPELPVAVLINGSSASASEVFAGAIQDLDRGVVVGQRSYGKGLVQNVYNTPAGGAVKVTTARYYTPSGRLVQKLNYKDRDAEGNPTYTPDSLCRTYYTAGGRSVKDGGGITPDVTVKVPEVTFLQYRIVNSRADFDYATRYFAAHHEVPDTLVVTDEMFADFCAGLNKNDYVTDPYVKQSLDNLRQYAEHDRTLTPETEQALEALKQALSPDLETRLNAESKELRRFIDQELARRYYTEREAIARSLDADDDLQEAVSILVSPRRYHIILKPENLR